MRRLLLAAELLLTACPFPQPNPGPDPEPPPRAVDSPVYCAAACRRLRELGCPEGNAAPGGGTCEDVCNNAAEAGISLDTKCVMSVEDCDAVDRCTR